MKTAAFVTSWAVKKWGNARRYSKSRKKVRKSVVKIEKKERYLGAYDCLETKKNRLLFGHLWNAVITSRHKMEMKYSDKGTLVQRQRYTLPSRSLQYWLMNHCVRNTTSRRSVLEKLINSEIVFSKIRRWKWRIKKFNRAAKSKNINLPTMEKMPNLAVDAEEQKNDNNPDFQQSKAERKSEKHYHFHNCTFTFKEPQ